MVNGRRSHAIDDCHRCTGVSRRIGPTWPVAHGGIDHSGRGFGNQFRRAGTDFIGGWPVRKRADKRRPLRPCWFSILHPAWPIATKM